jgi:hypothetical protein
MKKFKELVNEIEVSDFEQEVLQQDNSEEEQSLNDSEEQK